MLECKELGSNKNTPPCMYKCIQKCMNVGSKQKCCQPNREISRKNNYMTILFHLFLARHNKATKQETKKFQKRF